MSSTRGRPAPERPGAQTNLGVVRARRRPRYIGTALDRFTASRTRLGQPGPPTDPAELARVLLEACGGNIDSAIAELTAAQPPRRYLSYADLVELGYYESERSAA